MLTLPRSLLIIAMLLPSGYAMASEASGTSCSFSYNQGVIDRLIVPTLKITYGANYTIWDLKSPGIIEEGNTIHLIFGQWNTDILDTPNFVIIVDRCASRVTKAYETSPFDSTTQFLDAARQNPPMRVSREALRKVREDALRRGARLYRP